MMKARLIFAGTFLLVVLLAHWVVLGRTSPLSDYFLWHVGIPNVLRALNVIPAVVAGVLSHSHGGGDAIIFMPLFLIQWFVIGLLLSPLFVGRRGY
jgi:ABC-type Co2+ transport system permease subunit